MDRDFPRAGRAAPRQIPWALPSGNSLKHPCQPSEKPVHPFSFTLINPMVIVQFLLLAADCSLLATLSFLPLSGGNVIVCKTGTNSLAHYLLWTGGCWVAITQVLSQYMSVLYCSPVFPVPSVQCPVSSVSSVQCPVSGVRCPGPVYNVKFYSMQSTEQTPFI